MSIKLNTPKLRRTFTTIYIVAVLPAVLAIFAVLGQHHSLTLARFSTFTPSATTNNVSTTAALGDVTKVADFQKILDCFRPDGTSKACLDSFITNYAGDKSIRQLLADMELSRTKNVTIENDCHPIAHAIGRYAYQKYGNIGDAFLSCDQSCHSGCYHGVMERLFYTPEQLANNVAHLTFADMQTKVPHICDPGQFKDPSNSVIFQCLHGVGHAILYSLDYDLKSSLQSCDLFETDYQRQSCYGGVVMENVTAFEKNKRDLRQGDPLYPCDALDDQYKSACYLMQTSVMSEYGLTNQQIADECHKAGDYAGTCFVSMGRDLSNYVRTGQGSYVAETCEDTAGAEVANCTHGVVYALIDNTWDASFAFPFCGQFKTEDNQRNCFAASISYYSGIYDKLHEDIDTACQQYAGDKAEMCMEQNTI